MTKISTHIMFQDGAEAALKLYASIFPDFSVGTVEKYGPDEFGTEGTIKRADVTFGDQSFIVIESPPVHDFDFTPSMSIFVDFEDRDTFDKAFETLSKDGDVKMPPGDHGFSQWFAWTEDRFGLSWQLNIQ